MTTNISIEQNQLKQVIKEVILEVISENKQEFSTFVTDILEEIALSKAIEEGEETELVDRDSIFAILEKE